MNDLSDSVTTLLQLRDIVRAFVDERDWQQFHSPKNLSMSLSIEVAELMEHFQWLTAAESRQLDAERTAEVSDELADVFCYLLAIVNELDLDLTAAFTNKMKKNRLKYPVVEYRGRFGADDPRPVSES